MFKVYTHLRVCKDLMLVRLVVEVRINFVGKSAFYSSYFQSCLLRFFVLRPARAVRRLSHNKRRDAALNFKGFIGQRKY